MESPTSIEGLLRRDRRLTISGLVALCVLAWLYLMAGAGLGMSLGDMATAALYPHLQAGAMPGGEGMPMGAGAWPLAYWALVIAMWWVMMIAMMTPSAAPMILLHARVVRDRQLKGQDPRGALDRTASFAGGYLLVWLAFSIAATAAQRGLETAGWVSAMTMSSQSALVSAAILIAAGIYQWTPLKAACLEHCRLPARFLSRHWRPGTAGAVRLGIVHGAYCVGCCWALMALLFAGGVMNPLWIVALTVIVLVEKLAGSGARVSRVGGAVLVVWGVSALLV